MRSVSRIGLASHGNPLLANYATGRHMARSSIVVLPGFTTAKRSYFSPSGRQHDAKHNVGTTSPPSSTQEQQQQQQEPVSYFSHSDEEAVSSTCGPYDPKHSFLLSGFPGLWTTADVASFLHTLIIGSFHRRNLELPEQRKMSPGAHTLGYFRDIPRLEESAAAPAFLEGFLEGIVFKTRGAGGSISGREAYVLVSNYEDIMPTVLKEMQFLRSRRVDGGITSNTKSEFPTDIPQELMMENNQGGAEGQQQQETAGGDPGQEGAPPAADSFDEGPVESTMFHLAGLVEITLGHQLVAQQERKFQESIAPRRNPDSVFPIHLPRRMNTGSSFYEKALAMDNMSLERYLLSPDLLLEKDQIHTKRYTKEGVDAVPQWMLSGNKFADSDDEEQDDEEEDDDNEEEGGRGGRKGTTRSSSIMDGENLAEGEEFDVEEGGGEDEGDQPESGWVVQPGRRTKFPGQNAPQTAEAQAKFHPYGRKYTVNRAL